MDDELNRIWKGWEPIRTTRMIRDTWLLALFVALHLLFAPVVTLSILEYGISTLSSELFELWGAYLSPGSFFLVAPGVFLLLTAHLLIHPESSRASRVSLALYSVLLVLSLIHETRLWLNWPSGSSWIHPLVTCAGGPGLLATGVLAYRNWKAPTLENAFFFNGLITWWLFTTAFPRFTDVWNL